MKRWLVLTLALAILLAGCTGKEDGEGDTDPTPTPGVSPTPTTPRATPNATSTPPSATPAGTPPTASPTASPTAPSATPPPTSDTPPSSKSMEFAFDLTANSGSEVPVPGIPGTQAGPNCGGFAGAQLLGGNITATYEASELPVAPDVELVLLAPDGSVLGRASGASPLAVTIPPVARNDTGIKIVVQYVEEPPTPQSTDVSVAVILVIPAADAAPAQDAATTCPRVE